MLLKDIYMLFCFALLNIICSVSAIDFLHRISHYEFVSPLHVGEHSRDKRDLSTKYEKNTHLDETTFQIKNSKKQFNINLVKNSVLLPKSFSCLAQSGEDLDTENCYYHGEIEGQSDSNVVLSTCNGLSGMIQEEDGETYFIEPHDSDEGTHVIFNAKHLKKKQEYSCGVNHTESDNHLHFLPQKNQGQKHSRGKRSTSTKKYIEVIAVMDFTMFQKYKSVQSTKDRAIQLMNFVDGVYKTMNTRVVLKKVIVWDKMNVVTITPNAGIMLKEFKQYSADVLHDELKLYPDNAQLITNTDFTGSLIGLAGIGVVCSLTSCGVNYDHTDVAGISANTIAHEMGHNLGFYHNVASCSCDTPPCIMEAVAPGSEGKGFTSCTKQTYNEREDNGLYPCLFDYPDMFATPPECGNGFLEEGETCDCGTEADCKASGVDKCCDFATCKLQPGAKCADGMCCHDCQFKSQGALCRKQMHTECDLEEFCLGTSAMCPRNSYVQDGVSCSEGRGLCHQGLCKTHNEQCKTLWGDVAIKAEDVCFDSNGDGDKYGNCGTNRRGEFIKCATENLLCGKIQCQGKSGESLPNLPRIGTDRSSVKRTYGSGASKIVCRVSSVHFSAELEDPTLTAEGTKCGENSICLENECKNISSGSGTSQAKLCQKPCQNGGVCNNNGNCHCTAGWACPYCELPGPGGSFDSGQGCLLQDDCECLSPLVKAMLVLFLLVIPLCILIGYLVFRHRANLRDRWGKYRQSRRDEGDTKTTTTTTTQSRFGGGGKTNLKTGTTSNQNVTYNQGNPYANNTSTTVQLPSVTVKGTPARKPPPPVPVSQPGGLSRPIPTVGSSSPRNTGGGRKTPGKLPQIAAYNQMDTKPGSGSGNVNKSYR